ncbi:MAG TPA: hypothetical protein VJ673_02865 [Aromatoleum sp.]|uniref:hypothetical protein n=1 Tax=Aromatoleum sp. TaxID=2307007 RepID=UPI002B48C451|nr:hypothetical protein [Aromatoleum sp.]HJV24595.1 hypothetical protein [Aromatoleum sp.]
MATLADAGGITADNIREEIARLRRTWSGGESVDSLADAASDLLGEEAATLDLVDRCQLNQVIQICRSATSLSDAGRKLFAISRQDKARPNDADRLRKYLGRFDLSFDSVRDFRQT